MNPTIRLDRCELKGNRLQFEFSSELEFFRKKSFFIEYDRELKDVPLSILTIPFAGAMAPITWATGADLIIPELDDAFAQSLPRLRSYFFPWFPKWPNRSVLLCRRVRNDARPDGYGMLFSGGLDSLTSYIRNQDKNPELFTIFGADIPLKNAEFIQACRTQFDQFAAKERVPLHYIYTDVRDVIDNERVHRLVKNWYSEVSHGLMLTSILAPASYRALRMIMVASCSHPADCGYPCGSDSDLIGHIRWAGSAVETDSETISRAEKIAAYLKDREDLYSHLRVCWAQFKTFNCGECEKCLRTICELLLNNIDPVRCNFKVDRDTLQGLRRRIQWNYHFFFRSQSVLDFWREIQKNARPASIEDRYGSKEFFSWFAEFPKIQKRQNRAIANAVSAWMDLRNMAGRAKASLRSSMWGL